ncbi:MAG: response regulator transcription factor [Lachnospiraceae bacterium]|nr:response regulator transcription factor [Lachnospiraceae bacterium]
MRILFAEDEADLNKIVTARLTEEGYSVDSCLDGEEAIDCLDAAEYDALVLDIMMPKADGYTVLKHLRDQGKTTPVLFLTARDAVTDRVKGLDMGANDYLVKPFAFDELKARIRAMTRMAFGEKDNILTVGDLRMDIAAHTVTRGERTIDLSAKEYALLEYLMHNAGTVLSREKIEDHIWNFDYEGGTNVVDVYISYLRKKIEVTGEPKLIQTVRGAGYMLRAD